jgi:hypothetical protein
MHNPRTRAFTILLHSRIERNGNSLAAWQLDIGGRKISWAPALRHSGTRRHVLGPDGLENRKETAVRTLSW